MKINVRIILINFVIVAFILTGAGITFYSIMITVLRNQQTASLNRTISDLSVMISELNEESDRYFEIYMREKTLLTPGDDEAFNFVFRLHSTGDIHSHDVLYVKGIPVPEKTFNIREFAEDNSALVIKLSRNQDGQEFLYGYLFTQPLLNRIAKRIGADVAVFDNSLVSALSNELVNQQHYYVLSQLFKQIQREKPGVILGGTPEFSYILSSLYQVGKDTYSNKTIDLLVFSGIAELKTLQDNLQDILILLGITGGILSIILTIIFTSRLRRQIIRLNDITNITRSGDFSKRMIVETDDELGQLGKAFNVMLDELEKKERQKNEYTDFITLINRNPSLKEVADAVLKNIVRTGGFSSGRICIVSYERLQVIAFFGDMAKDISPKDEEIFKEVISTKTDLLFSVKHENGSPGHEVREQFFITPVIYSQEVIALIHLVTLSELGQEALDYMNKIREQLAVGFMNAITLSRLEDLVRELRILNEEYQIQNEIVTKQNQRLKHLHEQLTEKAAELTIQKNKAEESTRLKSNFVATISHELRTPMNAILGLTELILNDPTLSYKNRERLEVALRSARRLITLINSILDISRIESGRIDMKVEEFSVKEFLAELDNSVRPLAETKRLPFRMINTIDDESEKMTTDRHKLMQVMINLCGNAIKFTEKGFVELRVFLASPEEVIFEVEDTGIGISPEEQEYIFEEFRQVDSSLSRKYEGSGLGLSISHKFSLLLKGKLTLQSKPGSGSTFTLTLPRLLSGFPVVSQAASGAGMIYTEEKTGADGKTKTGGESNDAYHGGYLGEILIVDDDPDTLFTLNELVKKSGCSTLLAKNGEECLEILESALPDMILMDLMMPRMDGFEAVRRIREDKRYEQVPVIAITAKTIDDDGDELLRAGFTGYIRKPFDAAALISKIKRIFKPKK